MTLENVKLETETRYRDNDDFSGKSQDVIVFKIPIPGGVAQYELPISKDFRSSIEAATKLK